MVVGYTIWTHILAQCMLFTQELHIPNTFKASQGWINQIDSKNARSRSDDNPSPYWPELS
jgi:hypothetical protein